jgi:hypothetical protein
MCTRAVLLFTIFSLIPFPLSFAGSYEYTVSWVDNNLYKVDTEAIYIRTRYCFEYVNRQPVLVNMNGYYGDMRFLDFGRACNVMAVYAAIDTVKGNYEVTISRVKENWYEIWGQSIYIETSKCYSRARMAEAKLSIDETGQGSLQVQEEACSVVGVYSRIKL